MKECSDRLRQGKVVRIGVSGAAFALSVHYPLHWETYKEMGLTNPMQHRSCIGKAFILVRRIGFRRLSRKPSDAHAYSMRIDDSDYEELLALFPKESIPADPTEARQAIENFIDLVELLMKPLPLPPTGRSSFKQPSSGSPRPSSQGPRLPRSVSKAAGHDSGIGCERR